MKIGIKIGSEYYTPQLKKMKLAQKDYPKKF